MQNTKITWADMSWNPVTGCKHTCQYCYARSMAKRFHGGFEPKLHENRLAQPMKIRKPKRIFVGSMADLFGNWVPESWIEKVFKIIELCPWHTFLLLTKNPERLAELSCPQNAWAGASTTNQRQLVRARALRNSNATIKYISAEPLLEPLRLTADDQFDWVIIGGQTGPKKIQPEQEWINNLTQDSRQIGASVFYKPNLDCYKDNPIEEFPGQLLI